MNELYTKITTGLAEIQQDAGRLFSLYPCVEDRDPIWEELISLSEALLSLHKKCWDIYSLTHIEVRYEEEVAAGIREEQPAPDGYGTITNLHERLDLIRKMEIRRR